MATTVTTPVFALARDVSTEAQYYPSHLFKALWERLLLGIIALIVVFPILAKQIALLNIFFP